MKHLAFTRQEKVFLSELIVIIAAAFGFGFWGLEKLRFLSIYCPTVVLLYSFFIFIRFRNKPLFKMDNILFGKGTVLRNEFDAPIRKMYFPVEISNGEKKKTVHCLIDTGATGGLHIQKNIADELGLAVTGSGKCLSLAHEVEINYHRANLKLGNTHFNNIEIESTAKILSSNEYEQGIIGMDIISHGNLLIKRQDEKFHYQFEI